ncbi:MAG: hypothetical protein WCJ22_04960 [Actinomycetes bacterium]
MAITKTPGVDDAGRPIFHYVSDGAKPVVLTGPISGPVVLTDGRVYDVSEPVIEVDSEEHAAHVSHLIGKRHETEGHPSHHADDPFVHNCDDNCPEG